jgi:hypothetical protein
MKLTLLTALVLEPLAALHAAEDDPSSVRSDWMANMAMAAW